MDPTFAPIGRAKRLTHEASFQVFDTAWTRDGRFVIYSVHQAALAYLWRVAADGRGAPERIEAAGLGALGPATARSLDRLVFSRFSGDEDVYRFEVGRSPQPLLTSPVSDAKAKFSPDGRRIAFSSNRSGVSFEIWVARADGSEAQQLTHGPGRWQGSPHWSPDGTRIAFDSQTDDGRWHIWTIEADGGLPQQVTKESGHQNIPSWSRDGQWIYFSWDRRSGGREIWRVRVRTGLKERVTTAGSRESLVALESPDGESVLYQPKGTDSALVAAPLAGGAARQIIPCVARTAFSTGPGGVYYLACGPCPALEVHVMNPATGVDRVLGGLDRFQYNVPSGFSVSPDGTSILYMRGVAERADLMLIENFR